MKKTKVFSSEEARRIGTALNIDWDSIDGEQFRMGLLVELEHGAIHHDTDMTNDDPYLTGKIALAHLREFPDYYTRLAALEKEAEAYWAKNRDSPAPFQKRSLRLELRRQQSEVRGGDCQLCNTLQSIR